VKKKLKKNHQKKKFKHLYLLTKQKRKNKVKMSTLKMVRQN